MPRVSAACWSSLENVMAGQHVDDGPDLVTATPFFQMTGISKSYGGVRALEDAEPRPCHSG
jgi:hypothetical protein